MTSQRKYSWLCFGDCVLMVVRRTRFFTTALSPWRMLALLPHAEDPSLNDSGTSD